MCGSPILATAIVIIYDELSEFFLAWYDKHLLAVSRLVQR